MTKQHAIYLRVSTRRQDTASQELELRRWAESHDCESCWYRDTYTGRSMDRPGFRSIGRFAVLGTAETSLASWQTVSVRGEHSHHAPRRLNLNFLEI